MQRVAATPFSISKILGPSPPSPGLTTGSHLQLSGLYLWMKINLVSIPHEKVHASCENSSCNVTAAKSNSVTT